MGAILKAGKVSLIVPEIVESQKLVALTVFVSGLAEDVRAVYLFTPLNEKPEVAQFYFTLSSGHAKVVTAIQVHQTLYCVAVAEMRNGDDYQARKLASVNICYGGG